MKDPITISLGTAGDLSQARDDKFSNEVVVDGIEQMRLIEQLDDEDRKTILKLIEKMLTNKKFKEFFSKNAAL